jgi:hypothetical protein
MVKKNLKNLSIPPPFVRISNSDVVMVEASQHDSDPKSLRAGQGYDQVECLGRSNPATPNVVPE